MNQQTPGTQPTGQTERLRRDIRQGGRAPICPHAAPGRPRTAARLRAAIGLLALVLLALPAATVAQAAAHRIAILTPGLTFDPVAAGLRDGLARLGYQEGRNVAFAVENTHGQIADLGLPARRLIAGRPDVLFVVNTAHTTAAKAATGTIPIVFAWVADPVRAGLVASHSASGNNLTGVTSYSVELTGKRLEILTEVLPGVRRVLAVVSRREAIAQACIANLEAAAQPRQIRVLRRDVESDEDIRRVLQALPAGAVDAIVHIPSTIVGASIDRLITRAKREKIPLIAHEDTLVQQGALMAFGPEFGAVGAQSASLVAKLLAGAKASELPIQTPQQLLLSVNLATANAIGLKVPTSILERADRLLE
jgi:putative tryptophan/tyrosine transport system substrate-binding protein